MSRTGSNPSEQAFRQRQIVEALRREIWEGRYVPGDRLPTRVQLEQTFGVSPVTMQRALDWLREEGLVITRGRRGTFVSSHPSMLYRFGVIFHNAPADASWSLYHRAIQRAAENATGRGPHRFECFYGLADRRGDERYHQLIDDVTAMRFAGLVFAQAPFFCAGTPVLTLPGLPRVALSSASSYGVPALALDSDSFSDKALAQLRGLGRRKVAVLCDARQKAPERIAETLAKLKHHGFVARPYWVQAAPITAPNWAAQLMPLLMADAGDRPDALLVRDDNLLAAAAAGLERAQVRVPEDVAVVSLANAPCLPKVSVPAGFVGYDMEAVFATATQLLRQQAEGKAVPAVTRIEAAEIAGDPAAADAEPTSR